MSSKLRHVRVKLADANEFVARLHRHHKPVVGHLFSLGAVLGSTLVGVAIVGRPVSRRMDDGMTLEVTRVATNGTANASPTGSIGSLTANWTYSGHSLWPQARQRRRLQIIGIRARRLCCGRRRPPMLRARWATCTFQRATRGLLC